MILWIAHGALMYLLNVVSALEPFGGLKYNRLRGPRYNSQFVKCLFSVAYFYSISTTYTIQAYYILSTIYYLHIIHYPNHILCVNITIPQKRGQGQCQNIDNEKENNKINKGR